MTQRLLFDLRDSVPSNIKGSQEVCSREPLGWCDRSFPENSPSFPSGNGPVTNRWGGGWVTNQNTQKMGLTSCPGCCVVVFFSKNAWEKHIKRCGVKKIISILSVQIPPFKENHRWSLGLDVAHKPTKARDVLPGLRHMLCNIISIYHGSLMINLYIADDSWYIYI